ncbi:MAG: SCP2 sterol-binding domain-containing protein [Bythopirellula sp.]|nr:SCP2 sterol-binding domain-containing protein [Bythopirellula sp.]
MLRLDDHPTVQALQSKEAVKSPKSLCGKDLRQLCLDAGADDVGFLSLDRPELDDQRADILRAFPATKSLISFVCRMNREPIRSPARSVANEEFHQTTDSVNEVARDIVRTLENQGIRAMNPTAGFPMEMSQFPGKIWVVSHKPVAVAAGLGQMGIHRNVIHPKFGNFIILGTILVGAEIDEESQPIHYNPCLTCKLCVAACPVGAIKPDGRFDPSACLTHNYREFMQGFADWTEQVVESRDALDYRRRVTDQETASLWQSLSFGANYKAAYCLAVCPAGEDVISPYLTNPSAFIKETVKPLQQKEETIYVVPHSDAEQYVARAFPHKKVKLVNGVRTASIAGFLTQMHIVFQAGQSQGLNAVYHFTFTGNEQAQSTVTIRNQTLQVERGLLGKADCAITADAATWLGFLRKEKSIVWAIMRRKVRVKGKLALLKAFGRCFPS